MNDLQKFDKKKIIFFILFVVLVVSIFLGLFFFNKKKIVVNPEIKLSDYKSIDLSNMKDKDSYEIQDVILLDLLDKSEVPEPAEEDIQNYISALDAFYTDYAEQVGLSKEEFMKQYVNSDNFDEIARENAIQYLKSREILKEIAARENIQFIEEDYDTYLETLIDGTVFDSVDSYKVQIEENGETEDMKEAAFFYKILCYLEKENSK